MSNSTTPEDEFELYHYTPSLPAAAVFAALFALSSVFHIFQLARTRTFYFIPLIIGGLMESIGYVGRILSNRDAEALGPYIMQTLLLLIAPALFAGSIYMILARLIRRLGAASYSMIRINWVAKVFVAGDVLSFLMQSGGGGIMAQSDGDESKKKLGENIVVGGLLLQILFFGFFVIVAFVFHLRIARNPTTESTEPGLRWKRLLWILYASSLLILIRSLFRVVEYIMGNDGYLLKNEVWLYVFDTVLMMGVMLLFNWCHPSTVVPGRQKKRDHYVDEAEERGEELEVRDNHRAPRKTRRSRR